MDNAKIYHANALKAACLALNIKLLHRKPRDPPGGGLVERFIETAQSQFESETGSLSADPSFVDAPNDFHLQPDSPARNAGDGDHFGEPEVDIGAYPLGEWPCH